MNEETINNNKIFNKVSFLYYGKKNQIEYSGKTATLTSVFEKNIRVSSCFSDSFTALWKYINQSVEHNHSVYQIKEFCAINKNTTIKSDVFYVVSQKDNFIVNDELKIYGYTNIKNYDNEEEASKQKNKVEQITIILYSYKSSLATIQKFVQDITTKYISSISDLRENKKFMYEVVKTKFDENICECWNEYTFESNRTFNNLFFDNKKEVLTKIHFFLKNKDWYSEKGIPYTLGIGLHGPPGTGKTSFIKALANETGRHIISFSFKVVKTKKDLLSIFFEDRYNTDNKKGSIGFDKKIIAFEDIDCIGNIILKRNNKRQANYTKPTNMNPDNSVISFIDKLVNTDAENKGEFIKTNTHIPYDEPITLDDILNIWDGIRETPGRIIIISSNHYEKLDPALIRPGRIDISLELTNASHDTIREIYFNLFKTHINPTKLKKIKPKFYSPAEIINIYISSNFEENKMINRLLENKHV